MKKLVTTKKSHSCENCGCTIRKGIDHFTERVYVPVKYDYEWESKSGGYTTVLHQHQYKVECDLAVKQVQEDFFNLQSKTV